MSKRHWLFFLMNLDRFLLKKRFVSSEKSNFCNPICNKKMGSEKILFAILAYLKQFKNYEKIIYTAFFCFVLCGFTGSEQI